MEDLVLNEALTYSPAVLLVDGDPALRADRDHT